MATKTLKPIISSFQLQYLQLIKMAQAVEDEKLPQGQTKETISSFKTLNIELDPVDQILKAKPSKIVALCKFTKMKEANDVEHDCGDEILMELQQALSRMCMYLTGFDFKNPRFPIWRISVSTYAVIMDKKDQQKMNDQFAKQIKFAFETG